MAFLDSGGSGDKSGGAGGILSQLGSSSSLGALAGIGGGIAGLLLGNSNNVPYASNLQGQVNALGQVGASATGEASNLSSLGGSLIQPLLTGQLPGGANDVVNQIVQKQTADTKAKYASLGQTGSTMEQSALNDIQTSKGALTFQIAQQMAQEGLQATSQSLQALNIGANVDSAQASIYENLMKAQMTNNSSLMSSIGSFTSAFAKALPSIV